jgi:hypothetical protein
MAGYAERLVIEEDYCHCYSSFALNSHLTFMPRRVCTIVHVKTAIKRQAPGHLHMLRAFPKVARVTCATDNAPTTNTLQYFNFHIAHTTPFDTHLYRLSVHSHAPNSSNKRNNGQPPQNPHLERLHNQHQPASRPRAPRPNHPRAARQRRYRTNPNIPPSTPGRSRLEREFARIRAAAFPLWGVHELF